jgi:hypothetical protein
VTTTRMLCLGVRLANDAPLAAHQVGNFLGPHRIEQLAQIDPQVPRGRPSRVIVSYVVFSYGRHSTGDVL